MLNSANMSFALCPLLTDGAIEALLTAGSDELKAIYLEKLISGSWTGTMNLTEPQAGSDLAAGAHRPSRSPTAPTRCSAPRSSSPTASTTWPRTSSTWCWPASPGAPEGVKGISLFVVPKFLVNADGSLGARNDVHCVSIEHKMGIKASPTAVLQFGDHGGAVGYLVGQENRGLEYMFIMMNAARYGVGVQGIRVAERAYQKAVQLRADRVQSRPVDGSMGQRAHHPPPRRAAHADDHARLHRRLPRHGQRGGRRYDAAHHHPDAEVRKQNAGLLRIHGAAGQGLQHRDEPGSHLLGVQVHGGMGFIEETGAAQYYRDAKILTIYEGTTAIQANDLVGRKTARDGGQTRQGHRRADRGDRGELLASGSGDAKAVAKRLRAARRPSWTWWTSSPATPRPAPTPCTRAACPT
jgi:alkylation response protein AidB-like acyl-CoA dehydrogenase